MKTKLRQQGFSLIELIIVIGIIGILSAVIIPSVVSIAPHYRLRAEARELVINFKKAKVEAVKRNQDVVIDFTIGVGGSYQMCADMDSSSSCGDAGDIMLTSQQLRSDMQLANNTFAPAGFNSRGLALGLNGQKIELKGATNSGPAPFTISLSTAGNVRLQ